MNIVAQMCYVCIADVSECLRALCRVTKIRCVTLWLGLFSRCVTSRTGVNIVSRASCEICHANKSLVCQLHGLRFA